MYMHTYIHTYIHLYYVCSYIQPVHAYIHGRTYVCTCLLTIYTCIHTDIHMYKYVSYMYVYIQYIYIYIYIICTCITMCTQGCQQGGGGGSGGAFCSRPHTIRGAQLSQINFLGCVDHMALHGVLCNFKTSANHDQIITSFAMTKARRVKTFFVCIITVIFTVIKTSLQNKLNEAPFLKFAPGPTSPVGWPVCTCFCTSICLSVSTCTLYVVIACEYVCML